MKAVLMTSSILILLIAALRPILRGKIPPKVQYALWLVAALRLLIPVNLVTSAYSALALLDRGSEPPPIIETIGQTTVPVQSYDSARAQVIERYHQQGVSDSALTPSDLMAIDTQARELMRGPTLAELAAKLARPVWLGGAALMALWFAFVNLRLRRKLKDAEFLDVDCPLPVYLSEALPSPCLSGVFRPAIYVTPAALESPGRLRHVLAHELTHYRHRDHWWALLRCACLCVYWFDPLVWWAAALSRQDCELACDEGAIRRLGEGERIPYGRTLVGMIAAGRNPLLQTATTMTGGKRRVKERVDLIARKPKTVIAVALALAVIVGCAVGCTFTGAPEDSPEPSPSASLEPDAERQPLDTLQERLLDIPEGLKASVVDRSSENIWPYTVLVDYWIDIPDEWEDGLGWLLRVEQLNQAQFEDILYTEAPGRRVIARDSEHYYAIARPTDVRATPETEARYEAAIRFLPEFVEQQVLATRDMVPLDQEELKSRDNLWEGKTYTSVAYWPYKAINGSTDVVWIFHLVQLAKDGPGGVWVPERVDYFDNFPQSHLIRPDTGGLTVLEYAENLQAEADAGNAGWATDPVEALHRYIEECYEHYGRGADSFTRDSAYIESVLAGTLPTEEQKAVQAVMDRIKAADEVLLTLAPGGGTSRVYSYPTTVDDYWALRLDGIANDFQWEEAPYSTSVESDSLRIESGDGSASLFLSEGSFLVLATLDGETTCYKGQYAYPYGGAENSNTPFEVLRNWFDAVELSALQPTTVPARGQSHEEIAREWAEGYEGALTKVAPGSQYACTSMEVINVKAGLPDWLDQEGLEEYVRAHNFAFTAEDFGKTWFGFSYQTVFVPVDQTTSNALWAGNTWYYEEEGAPEGALTYSRVGYLWLTDEGWTCTGTGTGL